MIDIIKSYDNPAGIKLEIGMAFWGGCTEWNGKTRCEGTISGWHSQDKGQHEKLAVKWDGYDWNQKAELVAMDTDEHGNSLGLKLLADDDGALPTKQLPQAAPAAPAQPQQPERPRQAAAGDEEIDKNGKSGCLKTPWSFWDRCVCVLPVRLRYVPLPGLMAFSKRVATGEVHGVNCNMGVTLSTGAGHAQVANWVGMGAAERVRKSGGPRVPPLVPAQGSPLPWDADGEALPIVRRLHVLSCRVGVVVG